MTRQLMLVVAYLLGSIPFAFIAVKLVGKGDVREVGSGNVGATNTMRAAGWKVALPVMLADISKGVLAVVLMRIVTNNPDWIAAAGLAAIIGHCFPVWLGFVGGKGVATAAGVFALLAWQPVLIAAGVWLALVIITRYVSVASMTAAVALPVAFVLLERPPFTVGLCVAIAGLVVISRHSGNIARLARGEERRLGGSKP
jgi:glycerol-3-phosphate acyltransferase PlsY